jgi:hypothetical protein
MAYAPDDARGPLSDLLAQTLEVIFETVGERAVYQLNLPTTNILLPIIVSSTGEFQ